jgi:release factor glutamine methyltransferase
MLRTLSGVCRRLRTKPAVVGRRLLRTSRWVVRALPDQEGTLPVIIATRLTRLACAVNHFAPKWMGEPTGSFQIWRAKMTSGARDDVRAPYNELNRLGLATLPPTRTRQLLRKTIHFLSYHFILKRRRTKVARVAGFRLTVRPTVFHPRYFLTSKFFASFLGSLDLSGERVADVGTGSGILALAAARAGAANVVATDINPNAVAAAAENAHANGHGKRIMAVGSDLLSALTPSPLFDVIISSPPSFAGEPRDVADRAWHAGPNYRDVASLFHEARDRLAPGGRLYVLFSTDSDLEQLGNLISDAGFRTRLVAKRSIFIESLLIYELKLQ